MNAKATQRSVGDVEEKGAGRNHGGISKKPVVLAVSLYVLLLILLGVSLLFDGRVGLTLLALAADFMVIFAAGYWPVPGMAFERVIGVIGAAVLVGDMQFLMLGQLPQTDASGRRIAVLSHSGDFGQVPSSVLLEICTRWAMSVMVVFVAFVILGFGRQMLRRKRTNMVRSLAHGLLVAVTMVGASGWLFALVLVRYFGGHLHGAATGPLARFGEWVTTAVVVLALLMMAGLLVAMTRWWRDLNASDVVANDGHEGTVWRRRGGWIGVGLTVPMLSGFVIYLAVAALVLLVG